MQSLDVVLSWGGEEEVSAAVARWPEFARGAGVAAGRSREIGRVLAGLRLG